MSMPGLPALAVSGSSPQAAVMMASVFKPSHQGFSTTAGAAGCGDRRSADPDLRAGLVLAGYLRSAIVDLLLVSGAMPVILRS